MEVDMMAFAEAWAQELEMEGVDQDLQAYLWAREIDEELDRSRPLTIPPETGAVADTGSAAATTTVSVD